MHTHFERTVMAAALGQHLLDPLALLWLNSDGIIVISPVPKPVKVKLPLKLQESTVSLLP